MTYEQYEQELARVQQLEKVTKEQIAAEQAAIESLKQQIADVERRIAEVIQEIYTILGITEADVVAAENEIASIRQELQFLLGLPPQELVKYKADIKKLEKRIADLKAKPVSYLWRIRDQIQEMESMLERLKANFPTDNTYTVQMNPGRRDCLYRISGFTQIYGDATQWPRIYRANKSQIDAGYQGYLKNNEQPKYSRAEDLIFPGQVLDIPR
jgi:nucleoid-associated protein YgaU